MADIATNVLSLAIMIAVGLLVGFSFDANFAEILAGLGLLLLFGYAFSWFFAYFGLIASSAEAAQAIGFMRDLPAHVRLVGLRAGGVDARRRPAVRRGEPVHHRHRRHPRAVARHPGRQRHLAHGGVVGRPHAVFALLSTPRYRKAVNR